jgi:fucose permease
MQTSTRLLLLAYLAFVSLGLPDTVFGVAWPSLREGFGLPPSAIGAVLVAGMVGYFLSGLCAGALIGALGVGGVLAASGGLVALALVGYALAPTWSTFFPIGLAMGLGSGAIDSGLNGYAARHFSVRHVNWLHASWGIGASLGPLLMTEAIARGFGYRAGYAALSLILAGMALSFLVTRGSWDGRSPAAEAAHPAADAKDTPAPSSASLRDVLGRGAVWLHIAAFFFYTGLESMVGQWCFTFLRERHGLGVEGAGVWTSGYWASLTLGRIALGFVVDRVGPDRLLRLASAGLLGGVMLLLLRDDLLGRSGLLLLGLSLAPIFPTLMARTPARLGDASRLAIGFQVSAATLGSASLPGLAGFLVAQFGLGVVPVFALALGIGFGVVHEGVLALPRVRERVA